MFAGKVHHLRHFRFCDLVRKSITCITLVSATCTKSITCITLVSATSYVSPSPASLWFLPLRTQILLMFAGKVHHLRHFGFCDLVRKHAAFAPVVEI